MEDNKMKLCMTQTEYIFKTITDVNASDKTLNNLFPNHKEFLDIIETFIYDLIEDSTPYYIHRYERGKKYCYPCPWDRKPDAKTKKEMRKYNIRKLKENKEEFIDEISGNIYQLLYPE
jgi:hypothetical protein